MLQALATSITSTLNWKQSEDDIVQPSITQIQ